MNYYEILNLSENATQKDIKKSYKLLVKKYHPDVYTGDKSFAEKKIKEINEAYDTLSNPSLKEQYDIELHPELHQEYTSSETDFSGSYDNSSNTYSSGAGNNYDKYAKVYNDYLNKQKSNNYSTYSNSKENYSDYYRASAYRTTSANSNYRYENEPKNYVLIQNPHTILTVLIVFFISSLFGSFLLLHDLTNITRSKEETRLLSDLYSYNIVNNNNNNNTISNSVNNTISKNRTENISEFPTFWENIYSENLTIPSIITEVTEEEKNTYGEYYYIGQNAIKLEDLKYLYETTYFSIFPTFDDFMKYLDEFKQKY